MKKLLLFIAAFPILIAGQNMNTTFSYNEDLKKIEYKEVVNNNLDKNTLYTNAKTWLTNTFHDYKDVIQFEDKETGKLIAKGGFKLNTKKAISSEHNYTTNVTALYSFTLIIECKDNRYRYTLTDLKYKDSFIGYNFETNLEMMLKVRDNLPNKINELENKDISKLKKKEQKEIEEQITTSKKDLVYNYEQTKEEVNIINDIISSLKKSMEINDDF